MRSKRKSVTIVLFLLLFGVACISKLRFVFVGLDIDEQYALALVYRIATGDLPVLEMWEPHQTSALFPGLFAWLYLKVSGGTAGFYVYMRIIGLFFEIFVAAFVYFSFSEEFGKEKSAIAALLVFTIVPKWIISPEFVNQQILWAVMTIICLYKSIRKDKHVLFHAVFAGLFMCLDVLAYPSAIFVFVALFVILAIGKAWKALWGFVGTCAVLGGGFLIAVLAYTGGERFAECIRHILSDPSHSESFGQKLFGYGNDFLRILVVSFACFFFAFLFIWILACKVRGHRFSWKLCVSEGAFSLWIVFMTIYSVVFVAVLNKPAVLAGAPYFAGGVILLILFIRKRDLVMALWLFGGVGGFIGEMLLTNLEMQTACVHLLPAMVALCLYSGDGADKAESNQEAMCVEAALSVFILVNAILYVGFVRWNEGRYPNIFFVKQKALEGPVSGVYCEYMDGYRYNGNMDFLAVNTTPNEKLLYIGLDNDVYLMNEFEVCSASTISTPVWDERYIKYYEVNPDKRPEVVVIDKKINLSEAFKEWISTNFKSVTENEYLMMYR